MTYEGVQGYLIVECFNTHLVLQIEDQDQAMIKMEFEFKKMIGDKLEERKGLTQKKDSNKYYSDFKVKNRAIAN